MTDEERAVIAAAVWRNGDRFLIRSTIVVVPIVGDEDLESIVESDPPWEEELAKFIDDEVMRLLDEGLEPEGP